MSIEGEEEKFEEGFPEPVLEPVAAADMSENGDVQSSPAPLGAASSASEPRLLWSAYRSFHAVKCTLNSWALKAPMCVYIHPLCVGAEILAAWLLAMKFDREEGTAIVENCLCGVKAY